MEQQQGLSLDDIIFLPVNFEDFQKFLCDEMLQLILLVLLCLVLSSLSQNAFQQCPDNRPKPPCSGKGFVRRWIKHE